MKAKFLFLLGLMCLPWALRAHQPDISSTMLAQQSETVWVLQVRAALTAFDYAIEQHFGDSAYATPEEFRELVIHYVKESMAVGYNGSKIVELEDGAVSLGHQTNVTFRITGLPEHFRSLKVTNTTFEPIANNQSALLIFKEGYDKKQFMLNRDNKHTANLAVSEHKLVLIQPIAWQAQFPMLLALALVTLIAVSAFLLSKKNQKSAPVGA